MNRPVLFVGAEIVNADDVFVGYFAGRVRFGQEAGFGLLILAAVFGQDLDRHGAADHGITAR